MGFDFTFRSLIDLTLVLRCGVRGDPGSFSSLWLSVIPTGPIVRTFCFLLESPGTLDKNRRTAWVTARPVPSALFCRAVRPPLCRRRVLAQLLSRSWNLLVRLFLLKIVFTALHSLHFHVGFITSLSLSLKK